MKDDLYVFANQGKSIRTHLWSLRELLKSNTQLEEIDPAVNSEEYIVKGNSMEQLKNHLVILQEQWFLSFSDGLEVTCIWNMHQEQVHTCI